MDTGERNIVINAETDIILARIAGGELAEQLGFDTIEKHCIITSISELAANIFFIAGSGTITLAVVSRNDGQTGLQVIASDEGPGIQDLEQALQDGYSTSGGLGGGLPGVNRLMSEMAISSVVGQGTVVRAVKWLDDDRFTLRLYRPERDGERT